MDNAMKVSEFLYTPKTKEEILKDAGIVPTKEILSVMDTYADELLRSAWKEFIAYNMVKTGRLINDLQEK